MTTTRKYSQNDEQQYIASAFERRCNGRFLDIGAWEPKNLSNTRALYEAGWSGVLVEPSPVPFSKLQDEYADDDRITLINAAASVSGNSEMEMFLTDYPSSTTERDVFDRWSGKIPYRGRETVPCVSLDWLLQQFGPFDFVNIDTEGTSSEFMIYGILNMRDPPKCVCVEYDNAIVEILSRATQIGYVCTYVNGENLILVKH